MSRRLNWRSCSTGVYLSMAPVILDAGADYPAAGDALLELVAGVEADQRATLSIDLGADPLTAALSRPARADDRGGHRRGRQAWPTTTGCGRSPSTGPRSTTSAPTRRGSSPAASPPRCAYLRVLTESGLSVGEALRQISFRLAADDDQFMTIAKFRAAPAVGAGRRGRRRAGRRRGRRARRDVAADDDPARPWVNMLRTHAGRVRRRRRRRRHRSGVPVRRRDRGRLSRHGNQFRAPDRPQHPAAAARGVARRPGPGSRRRVVVRRGPHRPAGEPGLAAFPGPSSRAADSSRRGDYIADQIAEIAARRTDDVAHRKTAITGVNEYPNLAEPPLPQPDSSYSPLAAGKLMRYAAEFEALRDRSDAYLARTDARPQALLLPLGPLAEHNIRTTFASNLLASGGIEAVNPGPSTPTVSPRRSPTRAHRRSR